MGTAETVEGERLSVRGAIEAIQRATSYGEPLRRRAEGLTWMAWGLTTGGLFLTALFLSLVVQVTWDEGWVDFIWVPWMLVGIALTYAAWRMAGVSPKRGAVSRVGASVFVMVALAVAFGTFTSTFVPAYEAAMVLLATGSMWTLLGATNLPGASPVGRRVMVGVGLTILAVGAAFAPFVPGLPYEGWLVALPLAIGVAGGVPFLAGLWQVVRG